MKELLPKLAEARDRFLATVKGSILWTKPMSRLKESVKNRVGSQVKGAVSVADIDNASSIAIAWEWASRLPGPFAESEPTQDFGKLFQLTVRDFLETGFRLGADIRPGNWHWKTEVGIANFDQYSHMENIRCTLEANKELRTIFSEQFVVKPDIVVYRSPVRGEDVGRNSDVRIGMLSPLLDDAELGCGRPLLHASISCNFTMRSNRALDTRTETLNRLRNGKGRAPSIVAVTAEPLPTRLSSLALGTGDVDFVYHAALPELREALSAIGNEDQLDMLNTMVEGRRLRDISDLALDLLI